MLNSARELLAAAMIYLGYSVDNPALFPPPAEARKLQMLRDFDAHSRRELSRWWTEIKVR